ncbi:hypothetical protein B484DRAFT_401254 [Ochromonadaceae sp. CCMP2298]|nr:hypothetical protein B484DRAFT_401254 [Ochromonadaceae sp. CCMP2298]
MSSKRASASHDSEPAKRPRPAPQPPNTTSDQIMVGQPDTPWARDFAALLAAGEIVKVSLSPPLQGSFQDLYQKAEEVFEKDDVQEVHRVEVGRGACRTDVGFICDKVLRLLTAALLGQANEPLTNLLSDDSTLSLGRVTPHALSSLQSCNGLLTVLYAPSSGSSGSASSGSGGSGSGGSGSGGSGSDATLPPALTLLDALGQPVPLSAGEVAVWAGGSLQEATMGLISAARYTMCTHTGSNNNNNSSSSSSTVGYGLIFHLRGSPDAPLDARRFLSEDTLARLLRSLLDRRPVLTVGQFGGE